MVPAKIFVGGLNWDTTDDGFRAFFGAFGEIEESLVMRDRMSGTSRGFGFVVHPTPRPVPLAS
jgi:RNA-binding protein Musashi